MWLGSASLIVRSAVARASFLAPQCRLVLRRWSFVQPLLGHRFLHISAAWMVGLLWDTYNSLGL